MIEKKNTKHKKMFLVTFPNLKMLQIKHKTRVFRQFPKCQNSTSIKNNQYAYM